MLGGDAAQGDDAVDRTVGNEWKPDGGLVRPINLRTCRQDSVDSFALTKVPWHAHDALGLKGRFRTGLVAEAGEIAPGCICQLHYPVQQIRKEMTGLLTRDEIGLRSSDRFREKQLPAQHLVGSAMRQTGAIGNRHVFGVGKFGPRLRPNRTYPLSH